jgi:hypothetical protein
VESRLERGEEEPIRRERTTIKTMMPIQTAMRRRGTRRSIAGGALLHHFPKGIIP